jgi:transposase
MVHSRIEEAKKAAKTVRGCFWGMLSAIRLKATNGMAEAKDTRMQRIKRAACDFRNKQRFIDSILFRLGGLDMAWIYWTLPR